VSEPKPAPDAPADLSQEAEIGVWADTTYAEDGTSVYVRERGDRLGTVRARWQRPDGRRPWVTLSTASIRNDDGTLVPPSKLGAVRAAAARAYEAWKNPPPKPTQSAPNTYTIGDAWDLYLDPLAGAKMLDKVRKDKKRARATIANLKDECGSPLLPETADATKVSLIECQIIWRSLLDRTVAGDQAAAVRGDAAHRYGAGRRTAEFTVDAMLNALNYSRSTGKITNTTHVPSDWRPKLEAEWETKTQVSQEPYQPRYSVEEARALAAKLPDADPRLQLAFEFGADLRPVQVVRARRRHLTLEGGAFGIGVLTILGDANKGGAIVDLTPEQRAAWDKAVGPDGFLREFEAAFQEGAVPDYFLFPSRKLIHWDRANRCPQSPVAPVKRALSGHMEQTSMHELWLKLETAAGVEHVYDRGMYGMRRLATDLADDVTDDEAVKDEMGGWAQGGGTRQRIYRAKQRKARSAKAARARQQVRQILVNEQDSV
jgi:hypothetical protein